MCFAPLEQCRKLCIPTPPLSTQSVEITVPAAAVGAKETEKKTETERERSTQKENHRNLLIVNNNVDDK